MYELLVGEIGITEEQFYTMPLWKIRSIIRGYQKRCRDGWHQTRFLAWIVANGFGGKIDQPEELITFSWEKEQEEPVDYDALQRMVEEAQEYNKTINTHS